MADSTRYIDWFVKAQEEIEAAEILMRNNGSNSIIAFLCQQAVEKAYKGYILKSNQELIEGHSLVYLCRKAVEINDSFKLFLRQSAYLNQFYIETRYPADISTALSKKDAAECLTGANEIIDFITALSIITEG
jgi:HEPN domain-containing protein